MSYAFPLRRRPTSERTFTEIATLAAVFDSRGHRTAGLVILNDDLERKREASWIGEIKTVCEAMPQLVWTTHPDGTHEYFNSKWVEYTGCSLLDSYGEGWRDVMHPDDAERVGAIWGECLRTGTPYQVEYRIKRASDGMYRWFLGRALPLRDDSGKIKKWLGTSTEIHDQHVPMLHLREAQHSLKTCMANAAVLMWSVDREGQMTLAEGKLPCSDTSPVGKSVYDVFKDVPKICSAVSRLLAGAATSIEDEYCANGEWYRMQATSVIDHETNTVTGIACVSSDITARKQAEKRLEESELRAKHLFQLMAAEAAAKEASRLKSEFLANMSHELRTPINGVVGMTELLLDTSLSEEQRDCAANIQRSADALLTVIQDILDFSKVEAGKLELEDTPFSLPQVLSDTAQMVSYNSERKGVRFRREGRVEDIRTVRGDSGRVRQVLANLLSNAVKFTNEGEVFIQIELQDVSPAILYPHIKLRVQVFDTGVGISEATRARLFVPFQQGDSSTARRFGGTGLGLVISKKLIELMGGEIGIEGRTDTRGSRAWFSIPLRIWEGPEDFDKSSFPDKKAWIPTSTPTYLVEDFDTKKGMTLEVPSGPVSSHSMPASVASSPAGSAPSTPKLGRPMRILVAEDNDLNCRIVLRMLAKLGHQAEAVGNGAQANPDDSFYDLILMDCQMPEVDGYEAATRVRTLLPPARDVPIVALTANAIKGDREKCLKAGMDDYLPKPFKQVDLEKVVTKWVGKKSTLVANSQESGFIVS
ncbi:hypothetical protein DFS34DRAFT_584772 [Phlyctochytrium arcticum]|nr:hypothetical protein DFS34DRAFT_584772 [Phlyctochytrium arcticum]